MIHIIYVIKWLKTTKPIIHIKDPKHVAQSHILENAWTDIITTSSPKVTSVPKNQTTKRTEIYQCVISKWRGLIALFTHYSNTNVCCLNHIYIISTIPDRYSDFVEVIYSYKTNDISFLCSTCSINHNSASLGQNVVNQLSILLVTQKLS